ncbi:MAG TPA: CYTH domain-containing protein, partial [Tetragenococcus sp.]|nr:CYTH domain-containing protein [Tetragenococcus sp.]
MVLLEQNFEIEFKNLLTKNEYLAILAKEFPDASDKKNGHAIHQSNYYFDTINQDLKKQHSALRVRVTDSYNEMTLKVPYQGFLMENNLHLSNNKASEIINNKQIVLSSFNSPDNDFSF